MEIRTPVIECRKQETLIRHIHDPVPDPVLDPVVLCIIAEPCLRQRYRTDTHEQIFVHFVRCVKHLKIVRCFSRDIIHRMDQDNIIILGILICSDHLVIELLQKHIVFQLAVAQFQKELLRSAGHLRIDRKFHVQHVLSYSS